MAEEIHPVAAHDPAIFLAEGMGVDGGSPLPFDRQAESMMRKQALDLARCGPVFVARMDFRALRQDRSGRERRRKRLPQEDVGVEMDKRPLLQAVCDKLAQRPPAGVGVVDPVEVRANIVELQPQAIDQHCLAGRVGDQLRFGEMTLGELQREPPGKEIVPGFAPVTALVARNGLLQNVQTARIWFRE